MSCNLERRHLTASQRACIAVEVLPALEAEAKARQVEGGKNKVPQKIAEPKSGESREQAAKIVNTNRQYISDAKKLKADAPEVYDI